MSYTFPDQTAADFEFSGVAYTFPDQNAADFSFASEITGYPVEGFSSTQVGTPTQVHRPTSVGPVATCGTPKATSRHMVFNTLPATVVSRIYFPTNTSHTAVGSAVAKFGTPIYRAPADIRENITVQVAGFAPVRLGTPVSPVDTTHDVYGFNSTRVGAPVSRQNGPMARLGTHASTLVAYAVSVTPATAIGTPAIGHRVATIASLARLGTPDGRLGHLVATLRPRAKVGRPVAYLQGHKVYGFWVGRKVGAPVALLGNPDARVASGFQTGAVGTPQSLNGHRVAHIPPGTGFGSALLKRSPSC